MKLATEEAGRLGPIARTSVSSAHVRVDAPRVFGEVRGRAGIAATWETLFSTFADFAVEVSDVLVDGDRVAVFAAVREFCRQADPSDDMTVTVTRFR